MKESYLYILSILFFILGNRSCIANWIRTCSKAVRRWWRSWHDKIPRIEMERPRTTKLGTRSLMPFYYHLSLCWKSGNINYLSVHFLDLRFIAKCCWNPWIQCFYSTRLWSFETNPLLIVGIGISYQWVNSASTFFWYRTITSNQNFSKNWSSFDKIVLKWLELHFYFHLLSVLKRKYNEVLKSFCSLFRYVEIKLFYYIMLLVISALRGFWNPDKTALLVICVLS